MTNNQRNSKRRMLLESRRRKLMASRMAASHERNVAIDVVPATQGRVSETITMIRGLHLQYISMDAVIGRYSGEILRTYEHHSGRMLLDFGAGAFPSDLGRNHSCVHAPRDSRVDFSHDGSSSSVLACAERMVAHAFMRDHLNLPPGDLILNENGGTCGATGQFISRETALLLALSGVVWSAHNGIMPTAAELELPLRFLSGDCVSNVASLGQTPSVAETIKRLMSEVVWILNRHSKYIRMLGRLLSYTGHINAYRMHTYIESKGGYDDSDPIWDCGLTTLQQPAA